MIVAFTAPLVQDDIAGGLRKLHRLSALQVAREVDPGYYADGGGLHLQIALSGSRSWIFRYQLAKRSREMGLGALSSISLAEARAEAADMNSYRFGHPSDSERHLGRPPSSAGDDSSLAREPVLSKLLRVCDSRILGVEIAKGPIRRLGVKSDLREYDLSGEFALLGDARLAVRFIAAQDKYSLHCIGRCVRRRDRSTEHERQFVNELRPLRGSRRTPCNS